MSEDQKQYQWQCPCHDCQRKREEELQQVSERQRYDPADNDDDGEE